jgi:hypothetical protein
LARISSTGLRARDASFYQDEKTPELKVVAPVEERKHDSVTLVSDFETYRERRD